MKALRFVVEETLILYLVATWHWEVDISPDAKFVVKLWLIVAFSIGIIALLT